VTSDLVTNHNNNGEEAATADLVEVTATDPVAATELVEVVPDTTHNDDPVSEQINPAPATSVLIQCDLAPSHNLDPSDVDQRIADAKVSVKNEMKLLFKTQIENLSNTVSSLLARVTEQDKQIRILKSQHGDLKKMVVKPQSHSCTQTVVPQPVGTDTQTVDNDVTNSAVSDKSLQNDHSTDTDADLYSVPVKNKFSPLDRDSQNCSSDNAASDSSKKQSIVSTQAKTDNQRPHQTKSAASPREKMMQAEVLPATTHVLLGDSVLARVKGQDVFPRGTKFQNLSVSGLTVADLIVWLRQAPVRQNVLTVVVHVGVNTCKYTGVTGKVWRDLLHSVSRCFPRAEIAASSIVPPCEPLTLQRTVHNSNAGLWRVCTQEHIIFVDHRPAFLTDTGALRYNLYGDAVHPSARGTLAVAGNIRSALRKTEYTPDHSSNPPSGPSAPSSQGRVPLLPDPHFPFLPKRNIDSLLPAGSHKTTGYTNTANQSVSGRSQVSGGRNLQPQSDQRDRSPGQPDRDQRDRSSGQPALDPRDYGLEQTSRTQRDLTSGQPSRDQGDASHVRSECLPPQGGQAPSPHQGQPRHPERDLSRDSDLSGPSPAATFFGAGGCSPVHGQPQPMTNQPMNQHGYSTAPAGGLLAAGGYAYLPVQHHPYYMQQTPAQWPFMPNFYRNALYQHVLQQTLNQQPLPQIPVF
jgi:hypothetical protein